MDMIAICHKIYIPTPSIARPSKIYPNWDFWFENLATPLDRRDGEKTHPSKTSLNRTQERKANKHSAGFASKARLHT
jgi:hypothetical protein